MVLLLFLVGLILVASGNRNPRMQAVAGSIAIFLFVALSAQYLFPICSDGTLSAQDFIRAC